VQPKAAYRSDFHKDTENYLQRGFNPGTSRAAGKRATTRPLRPARHVSEFYENLCIEKLGTGMQLISQGRRRSKRHGDGVLTFTTVSLLETTSTSKDSPLNCFLKSSFTNWLTGSFDERDLPFYRAAPRIAIFLRAACCSKCT